MPLPDAYKRKMTLISDGGGSIEDDEEGAMLRARALLKPKITLSEVYDMRMLQAIDMFDDISDFKMEAKIALITNK